jgi:hypothetical protein
LPEQLSALSFTHDGKQLIVAGKRLHWLDTERLRPTRELALPTQPSSGRAFTVTDVRFSPDDKTLAVLLLGGLALIDVPSGHADVAELPNLDPVGVRFAPDGRLALFGRHAVYVGPGNPAQMASSAYPVKGELGDVQFRKDGSLMFFGSVEGSEPALLEWHL